MINPGFLRIAALASLLTACSNLTVENYDKLKVGMSYEEVSSILGSPSKCDDVIGIKSCQWGDENRNITVNFVGGKVVLTGAQNIR